MRKQAFAARNYRTTVDPDREGYHLTTTRSVHADCGRVFAPVSATSAALGQHRVRYFGWLHPAAKARRLIVETLLAKSINASHGFAHASSIARKRKKKRNERELKCAINPAPLDDSTQREHRALHSLISSQLRRPIQTA